MTEGRINILDRNEGVFTWGEVFTKSGGVAGSYVTFVYMIELQTIFVYRHTDNICNLTDRYKWKVKVIGIKVRPKIKLPSRLINELVCMNKIYIVNVLKYC